jgi:hypothetical protein
MCRTLVAPGTTKAQVKFASIFTMPRQTGSKRELQIFLKVYYDILVIRAALNRVTHADYQKRTVNCLNLSIYVSQNTIFSSELIHLHALLLKQKFVHVIITIMSRVSCVNEWSFIRRTLYISILQRCSQPVNETIPTYCPWLVELAPQLSHVQHPLE